VTEHYAFSDLDIHTADEIEVLARSMRRMEDDIHTHISNLEAVSSELAKTRIEADQMNQLAKKDTLTGIRNKLSYNEHITVMQHQLKEGDIRFGILIADLDGLKIINDTYGHDKGDIAIKTLSDTICEFFSHSPVFRIGGDEFAVIIRNTDYDNASILTDKVTERFEDLKSNDALEPWEQVSASLGYALYNPAKDKDVSAVFRRADQQMYEWKKKSKARRRD
jgi:diguanylate cyclase (GGDEF)-like protein